MKNWQYFIAFWKLLKRKRKLFLKHKSLWDTLCATMRQKVLDWFIIVHWKSRLWDALYINETIWGSQFNNVVSIPRIFNLFCSRLFASSNKQITYPDIKVIEYVLIWAFLWIIYKFLQSSRDSNTDDSCWYWWTDILGGNDFLNFLLLKLLQIKKIILIKFKI